MIVRSPSRSRGLPLRGSWVAVAAASLMLVLIGGPLLVSRLDTTSTTASQPVAATTIPSEVGFLMPVPGGEALIGSGDDWEMYGLVTSEGDTCYRVILDEMWCQQPSAWNAPGVLNWGATWGNGPTAEAYGLIGESVARVEIGFPTTGTNGEAILVGPDTEFGLRGYFYRYDADTSGLAAVFSAYDSDGHLLGSYDLRDDCSTGPAERFDKSSHIYDARSDELCN